MMTASTGVSPLALLLLILPLQGCGSAAISCSSLHSQSVACCQQHLFFDIEAADISLTHNSNNNNIK
jgi:hypothetical protein